MRLLHLLRALAAARKGVNPSTLLMLLTLLRRTPIGMVEMFFLRRLLAGNERVFGMNLASRRQKRMAWVAGLLQRRAVKR